MLKSFYPYYIGNEAIQANQDLKVFNKFNGECATRVALADQEAIQKGIAAAVQAARPMRQLKAFERQQVLYHCVSRFKERFDELSYALCIEAGKPLKDSRGEVNRLISTFQIAAEESVRMNGEILTMDITPAAADYRGQWKRVPIGPCSFISPFNFPLNLAAHKMAAAIAVGCPFVMKPASLTPIGALIIGEVLAETSLPKGAFSVLPCSRTGADLFTTDERLKLLSFTGSPVVGWELKRKAGKKKVVLELGGNAACIVDEDTDLEDAAQRIIIGAFYQSGQSCISVQRIMIHERVYDQMRDLLVGKTLNLKCGNPLDEDTFIGPLITEGDAIRLEKWIKSAVQSGGTLLCGGQRSGAMLTPALLENVGNDEPLVTEEAFGPVAVISKFSDFKDAIKQANDSVFGLQAGVFTRDIYKMHYAWDELEVGGVVIGDIPSWRVDHMPYGGVKDSGFGREGLRWAMEDMTEIRLLVTRMLKN